jgi:hypothetical protein
LGLRRVEYPSKLLFQPPRLPCQGVAGLRYFPSQEEADDELPGVPTGVELFVEWRRFGCGVDGGSRWRIG